MPDAANSTGATGSTGAAGSTGNQFTPSFSLSDDRKSVVLETAPGERTTLPADKFLAQYNKGGGFDKQGEELGKLRKQYDPLAKEAETFRGLFGQHLDAIKGIKDEAKFEAALKASFDAIGATLKPGRKAATDDPLAFLNDSEPVIDPNAPKPATLDDVRAEVAAAQRATELKGELVSAMQDKGVPERVRDKMFNLALMGQPDSAKSLTDIVGELNDLFEQGYEEKRQQAEASKAAEKAATAGNASLMGRGASSASNTDPRSKAAMDSPEYKAYLADRFRAFSTP